MENECNQKNIAAQKSSNDEMAVSKKESKFYETLFFGAMAGFGLLFGFSNGLASMKKKDEKAFNKGLLMLPDGPLPKASPPVESGARLAMRALGLGSIYAFAGVGVISGLIWFAVGAKDFKEFREKVGEKLPHVKRNDPPQGRTEFESFRDLFTYLAEESEKAKRLKESSQKKETKPDS